MVPFERRKYVRGVSINHLRLRDRDFRVRQAAVIELAPRAAEAEVRDELEIRLYDDDLAVVKVAAAALILGAGDDGLRRVLRAYDRSEDTAIYVIYGAVEECCWSDVSIDASVRAIAAEQPETDESIAAADIVRDLWSDPRLSDSRPRERPLWIVGLLNGDEKVENRPTTGDAHEKRRLFRRRKRLKAYDRVRLITDRFVPEGAPYGSIGNIIEDLSDVDKEVQIWLPEQDETPLITARVTEIEPEFEQ